MSIIHERHHIGPSSRDGSDEEWNLCYFRVDPETVKKCRNLARATFKRLTTKAYQYLIDGKTYIDLQTLILTGLELEIHKFLHACFHSIFTNALPSEQIVDIKNKYTNKDGSLNKRYFPTKYTQKRIQAWIAVFGVESVKNTQIAVDFIEKYFLPAEKRWRPADRKRKRK